MVLLWNVVVVAVVIVSFPNPPTKRRRRRSEKEKLSFYFLLAPQPSIRGRNVVIIHPVPRTNKTLKEKSNNRLHVSMDRKEIYIWRDMTQFFLCSVVGSERNENNLGSFRSVYLLSAGSRLVRHFDWLIWRRRRLFIAFCFLFHTCTKSEAEK